MLFSSSMRGSIIFASMYISGGLGMWVVRLSVGSVAVFSGSALNELFSLISCSHCFFSSVSVFLPLANGVTLRFLLEVATIQLSSWCVGSLFPSLDCDISMLSSFFSAYAESGALFIRYVSPVLVIFIGGICMFWRLLCRFLFPLAALSLEHCLARPFRSAAQAELFSKWRSNYANCIFLYKKMQFRVR